MGLIKFNFLSRVLREYTNVTVVLPTLTHQEVEENPNATYVSGTKFQTLYLLHGVTGDDSHWGRFTSVERYAQNNKIALVMPSADNGFYSDLVDGRRYWTFISEELPNIARAYFPLSEKREDNFVAGLSMGGHGAMAWAIKRPEMFSTAVCLSGASIGPDDIIAFSNRSNGFLHLENMLGDLSNFKGGPYDIYHFAKLNIGKNIQLPRFYFAVGSDDFGLHTVKKAADYLKELGYSVKYEEKEGYEHEWDFWDLYIRKAIEEWLPLKRKPILPDS